MNYTFSGFDDLTQEEYKVLKYASDAGYCPFCGSSMNKRFRGDKRHMLACPSRESFDNSRKREASND